MEALSNAFPTRDPEWVQDVHANNYLQSWSKQGGKPSVITGAQGSWFWDSDGKRYLDFQSQLVNANLGHQHPRIVQAIKDQADKLCYIGPAMGSGRALGAGGDHDRDHAPVDHVDLLHHRRIGRQRDSGADRPSLYRPQQNYCPLPQLSRRDRRHAQPDRRSAPPSDPVGHARHRAHARPLCLSPAVRPHRPCELPDLPGRPASRRDPDV